VSFVAYQNGGASLLISWMLKKLIAIRSFLSQPDRQLSKRRESLNFRSRPRGDPHETALFLAILAA